MKRLRSCSILIIINFYFLQYQMDINFIYHFSIYSLTFIYTSKISQTQMNVPIRTRANQQVQTDVNLITTERNQSVQSVLLSSDSPILQFVYDSWLEPYSDYYLLTQLNTVVQQLKKNSSNLEETRTRRIIDELAGKIHGLLCRQFKLTNNKGYYELLMEKEKDVVRQQIRHGIFEKNIDSYKRRIEELQRQIFNLRNNLKMYQSASEENQLYKGFFRGFKDLTVNSRKITDFDKLLNEQILPKIKQFEINLAELSKVSGRDRSSKQKAAISRYALELDNLSKVKDLSWQALGNSAASFYSSIEHLNDDNWVNNRIKLSDSYDQLRTRYTSVLSLINKNINNLKNDPSFKKFSEIAEFVKLIDNEQRQGCQILNVNGWIGLGVIHCHREHETHEDVLKLRSLISLFQTQIKKLIAKYPQLDGDLSRQIRQFLSFETSRQFADGDAISWLKQIIVKQTQVIHVDNEFRYNNQKDKKDILNLKYLLKALLEQLRRLARDYKVSIQLPEVLLELLNSQQLDGINLEDIMGFFGGSSKICQVQVLVDRPVYLPKTQTVGIPLKQEKAVIVADTAHFAVNLQHGVPYKVQIPYTYSQTDYIVAPEVKQRPYGVPMRLVEQVTRFDDRVNVARVEVQKNNYVQVVKQILVNAREQVLQTQQVQVQHRVQYVEKEREAVQVQVQRQVAKTAFKQINKIFKVEQVVPKVYKQSKFQVVQKPVHHVVIQKEIEFVEVQKPIIQRSEVAVAVEVLVQKPIYIKEHCDCQKPDAVSYLEEKAVHVQIPKEIIVEKCHYVQGNTEQRLVEVACHTQIPIYREVIKQVPLFIQKFFPLRTIEQKLIMVDRQIPFVVEQFTPVELIIQKPVIVKDIKHIPVEVQRPVPIYIEKFIPQIVQVTVERIVEKIVQVPRVVIVQKIVQKIVPIPRIVQKIKIQTQIVQVPFFIQTPILQIVQIPYDRVVTNTIQKEVIVEVRNQVLRVTKQLQTVEIQSFKETKTIIQEARQVQIVEQKLVKEIHEIPYQVIRDRIVDRVIEINQIIPVEQRVEIPIEVNCPVAIITEKPIFYKQNVVQVDVQRVEREKIVAIERQNVKMVEVQRPYIVKQKQIVELPGQTIILKEPELHIVQIEKKQIITATDIEERPVQHYLDVHKSHIINQQTFVVPEKEAVFLKKPYAVSIERPVLLRNQEMVVVESADTMLVKTRQGLSDQVVNVVTCEVIKPQNHKFSEVVPMPQQIHHLIYEKLPPNEFLNEIMVTNQSVKVTEVTNTVQVEAANTQILTKTIQIPVHMQRLFQKIMLLPQIVEVEKKVYMIQQINELISREVSLSTQTENYQTLMRSVQNAANQLLASLKVGRQLNTQDMKNKLNVFLQLLRDESRMPKIVERIKQVEVVRERDRPVVVYATEYAREKVLLCIISDLIKGIKTLDKNAIGKNFPERIKRLIGYQFGLGVESDGEGFVEYAQGVGKQQVEGKWREWLQTYDKRVGSRGVSEAEQIFLQGFGSGQIDNATLKAALQRQSLIHSQKLHEIERLKQQESILMKDLQSKLEGVQKQLSVQRYYRDLYFNQLLKIKRLLELKNYDQLLTALETITTYQQEFTTSSVRASRIGGGRSGLTGSGMTGSISVDGDFSDELQRRLSEYLGKLSDYENQLSFRNRQLHSLRQQNDGLRNEIDQIKLNMPVRATQSGINVNKFNEQWQQKIRNLEKNHFLELNHLREQLIKRATGSTEGTDQFTKNYEQLMRKYNEQSQNQIAAQNNRRNAITGYEDQIRDLNKELLTVKRDYENFQRKNETERKRVVDDYERRLTSTTSNQQKQLRRQLETLRKNYQNLEQRAETERRKVVDDYEKRMTSTASNQEKQLRRQLEQTRRNYQTAEQRFQTEKKRIVDDYEQKIRSTAGNQQRQLRRQLDTIKRNAELAEQRFENEKKKIIDEYERKATQTASNQEKELRRELETVKRNYDNLVNNSESQKKRIIDDFETKLRTTGGAQQRQLRRQLDNLKKNYENYQKNTETQRNKMIEDYERKLKQIQDDLERSRITRRGQTGAQQQNEQLTILKDKIKKLEIELQTSKKQIESYQKSRLGQTTYTSGIKQSGFEGEFQSPQSRYKSSGPKFEQGEGSGISRQEQLQQIRSSQAEKGRISKSGIRSKIQQGQEVRSSSSRVSGGSEGSAFRSSMTLRQFMNVKKAQDKDSLVTLVIIKVIQKIQEQADKDIINSYNPNNIYLSNFNPNNLQSLIVRFGAPITNRKSGTDGIYLSPEVLRGERTTLKSVVFTLAVIWDELIHYEIYYKTPAQVQNLALEYKVRDTSLNPILRNTLFEMMSKDPAKRLELGQAKRRLSLQRFIVSEGKAGTTTSRITSQSRKNL